jgi:tetratricopeptide (TPR) repeat protein
MPLINTVKKSNFKFLVFAFLFFIFLSGCKQKKDLNLPQEYAEQAEAYYQRAINLYQDLIAQGKDVERLSFGLAKLYYSHGEFAKAVEKLQDVKEPSEGKLLAISYYRLGNFTDALEAFNKIEFPDEECLYYQGLTSERLNLFEKALQQYRKIKRDPQYSRLARERIRDIEKNQTFQIKNIDAQAAKLLLKAPAAQKYPEAGALILSCDESIEITPDHKEIATLHYLVKILNDRGKNEFAETTIDYDMTYEKVELVYARTIKPDGETVEVGASQVRNVSKYLNFPLYSNAWVYIISFPEVGIGSAIEYKVKIYRNQLVNKKDFVLSYPLQGSEPILNANFTLKVPKGQAPHIKTLNEEYLSFNACLRPKINEEEGRLIYSWQFKDIPQIIPEPQMPPQVRINPALLFSTFDQWRQIYDWWWALAKDKIQADADIKAKTQELIHKAATDEEKARKIYNFCAKEIRYVAVEYGDAGYEPHSAQAIFRNKYGDCKDQAILLITMLRNAGLEAYPVLIATKDYYDLNEDFPALFFNHCIAAVKLAGKIIFLDPTAETCSFQDLPAGDQGRRVLVFSEGGYEILSTPAFPPEHNRLKQSLYIKLNRDESISGRREVTGSGIYDQVQRFFFLYTQPELIRNILQEKIQEISIGAKLQDYRIANAFDLNKPCLLSYTFRGPEYCIEAGDLRILPQLVEVDRGAVSKDERRYGLEFSALETREVDLDIEIPPNLVVQYMPEDIREESPWLKFSAQYLQKGNLLTFRQRTETLKKEIPEAEYLAFKDFVEKIAKRVKQRVVLEAK